MFFRGCVLEDVTAVLCLVFTIFSQVVGTAKWCFFIFKQKCSFNVTV